MVESAQQRREWRPLLIVDIAVPRDVETDAGELENVFLYNIDDLDRIVRTTIQMRTQQRDAAERIIEAHLAELTDRLDVRSVAPTIDALYRAMERIAAEELQAARNKLAGHDDAEADTEILQRALHRTIRRILHPCTRRLRDSAGTDAARAHIAALRELFDLDSEGRD
jgi:glutamyl-tRNA reductase